MGSAIAKRLIDRYAGNFLEKGYNIKVDLFGSAIYMKNVRIRPEALEFLNLPITVKYGYLSNLHIDYTFTSLTTAPIKVNIEDLFVIAAPSSPNDSKDLTPEQKEVAVKEKIQAKLDSLDLWEAQMFGEELKSTYGMADKIVDNLQISVKNIHIRFEGKGYSIGVGLKSIQTYPTDPEGKRIQVISSSPVPKFKHRRVEIDGVSVYLNTASAMQAPEGGERNFLMDPLSASPKRHWSYIIAPIRARADLTKAVATELELSREEKPPPKYAFSLEIALELNLSRAQYNSILVLVEDLQNRSPEEAAKKLAQLLPPSRKATSEEKLVYVTTYARRFKTQKKDVLKKPSDKELKKLAELERAISFPDVIELRRFALTAAKIWLEAKEKSELVLQGAQGVMRGLFWKSKKTPKLSSEEWEDIRTNKEYHDTQAKEAEEAAKMRKTLPPTYVINTLNATLSKFRFSLLDGPETKLHKLVSYEITSMRSHLDLRTASMELTSTLRTVKAFHYVEKGSAFPLFLCPTHDDHKSNLVDFRFHSTPPDKDLDTDITLNCKGLDVVYIPPLVEALVAFFKPDKPLNLDVLAESAKAIAQKQLKAAQEHFKKAMEKRPRVQLNVNIEAPNVIVPADPLSNNTNLIVADLGTFAFRSILAEQAPGLSGEDAKALLKKANSKSKLDEEVLESLYDRYGLRITDVTLFLTTGDSLWRQKESKSRLTILHPLDIPMTLSSAISPLVKTLPSTHVKANLTNLTVSVSPQRLVRMLAVVDAITPKEEPKPKPLESKEATIRKALMKPTTKHTKHPLAPVQEKKAKFKGQQVDVKTSSAETVETVETLDESHDSKETASSVLDYLETSVEAHLTMPSVTLNVIDDLPNLDADGSSESEKRILSASVNGLDLYFKQRAFDMHCRASIGSINVEDLLQNNSDEFRYIVSTNHLAKPLLALADKTEKRVVERSYKGDGGVGVSYGEIQADEKGGGSSTFFLIDFKDIQKKALDIYQGVQKNLKLQVGTLVLALNRETLPTMAHFFMHRLMPVQPSTRRTGLSPQVAAPPIHPNSKEQEAQSGKLRKYLEGEVGDIALKVDARFDALQVILNSSGKMKARFKLAGMSAGLEDAEVATIANVSLQGVWLADLCGGPNSRYPYAVATKSSYQGQKTKLVAVKFEKSKADVEDVKGYLTTAQIPTIKLDAQIAGIYVTVLARFLKDLANYPTPLLEELARPPPPDAFAAAVAAGAVAETPTPKYGPLLSPTEGFGMREHLRHEEHALAHSNADPNTGIDVQVEEKKVEKKDPYAFTKLSVSLKNVSTIVPQASDKLSALYLNLAEVSLTSNLVESSDNDAKFPQGSPSGSLLEMYRVQIFDPSNAPGNPGVQAYSSTESGKKLSLFNLPEIDVRALNVVPQSKAAPLDGWDTYIYAEIEPIPILVSNPQLRFLFSLSKGNLAEEPEDMDPVVLHAARAPLVPATVPAPAAGGAPETQGDPPTKGKSNGGNTGSEMIAHLKLKEIAIVLLEDPDLEVSRSMSLRWEAKADVFSRRSGSLKALASLNDVYVFNHPVRAAKPLKGQLAQLKDDDILVGPTGIEVDVIQTKSALLEGPLTKIDIKGAKTKFRVGYKDYALVRACIGSLSSGMEMEDANNNKADENKAEKKEEKKTEAEGVVNCDKYLPIGVAVSTVTGSLSNLEADDQPQGEDDTQAISKPIESKEKPGGAGEIIVHVGLAGAEVELVNDALGSAQPIARIGFSALEIDLNGFGEQQSLVLTTGTEIWYYNQLLCAWEPMLEPWALNVTADLATTQATVAAKGPLLINVSRGMYESVVATTELLSAATAKDEKSDDTERKQSFAPFAIQNHTARAFTFSYKDAKKEVPAWGKVPLKFEIEKPPVITIYAEEDEGRLPVEVDPKVVGKISFKCKPEVEKELSPLQVVVAIRRGIRVIEVRPLIVLENLTGSALSVVLPGLTPLPLAPGHMQWLPKATELKHVKFHVKMGKNAQPGCRWIVNPDGELETESAVMVCNAPEAKCQGFFERITGMTSTRRPKKSAMDTMPDSLLLSAEAGAGAMRHAYVGFHRTDETMKVTVHSPVTVTNLLPCTIEIKLMEEKQGPSVLAATAPEVAQIGPGACLHSLAFHPDGVSLQVKSPWDQKWSETLSISNPGTELVGVSSGLGNKHSSKLKLSVEIEEACGPGGRGLVGLRVVIFSPVWVYNACAPHLTLAACTGSGIFHIPPLSKLMCGDSLPDGLSTPDFLLGGNGKEMRVQVLQVGGGPMKTTWSNPGEIAAIANLGSMECLELLEDGRKPSRWCCEGRGSKPSEKRSAYEIGFVVGVAGAPFERTRIVTLGCRFIIVNELPAQIAIRQAVGGSPAKTIKPGTWVPFFWTHAGGMRALNVRFDLGGDDRWPMWSGDLPIDQPGDFSFCLRNGARQFLVSIQVRTQGPSLFVVLKPESHIAPPVRVINSCALDVVRFAQKDEPYYSDLQPYMEMPFAWDCPMKPMALSVMVAPENSEEEESQGKMNINLGDDDAPIRSLWVGPNSDRRKVFIALTKDGPTYLLTVSDVPLQGTRKDFLVSFNALSLPTKQEELQILHNRAKTLQLAIKSKWTEFKRDDSKESVRASIRSASQALMTIRKQIDTTKARHTRGFFSSNRIRCACCAGGRDEKKGIDQNLVGDVRVRVSVCDGEMPITRQLEGGEDVIHGNRRVVLVFEFMGKKRTVLLFDAKHKRQSVPSASAAPTIIEFLAPAVAAASSKHKIAVRAILTGQSQVKEGKENVWKAWQKVLGEAKISVADLEITAQSDVAKRAKRFREQAEISEGAIWISLGKEAGRVCLNVTKTKMLPQSARNTASLTLALPEVGLSIIDETPQEVFYLSMQWLVASVSSAPAGSSVELSLFTLQFDRLDPEAEFPVIFAPKAAAPEKRLPFIQLAISQASLKPGVPLNMYRYFSILMQEFDVKIEEAVIMRAVNCGSSLLQTAQEATGSSEDAKRFHVWRYGAVDPAIINKRILYDYTTVQTPPQSGSKKMFFRLLQLQPIAVNLSFQLCAQAESGSEAPNPIRALGKLAGAVIGNIDAAPLRLNALTIENAYGDTTTLLNPIISHYTSQALREAYKIVGSLDLLGDPVSLVGNLGEGVADFFYEPAQGLVSSPQEFGLGLARGTASLLKHTLVGIFGAASKITGSIGRGVAVLSFDAEYTAERAADLKKPPAHVGIGLYRGGRRLGLGLYHGVTGVLTAPYKGVRKQGARGCVVGCGVGLAGLVVKPAVGAVDLVSLTLQGIGNSATYFDPKYNNRIRRPRRYIGEDHILKLYVAAPEESKNSQQDDRKHEEGKA